MFFNQEVEKLSHKAELYVVWAWVSGAFSIAAVYKYTETNWSAYPVISGVLLLLVIALTRSAKKLKQEMISVEIDEIDEEREKEKRTALRENMLVFAKKEDEYHAFLKEIKLRSLQENIKLLDIKYKSLSSKDKIASYGEYEKSLKWLKTQYK
jgi:hypothetical protein